MGKKKSSRKKRQRYSEPEQDDTYYFIAGFTSWGFPYGVTWEQAYEDGIMEEEDRLHWEERSKVVDEEDIPF